MIMNATRPKRKKERSEGNRKKRYSPARLRHFQKRQQMHPLIIRLLQQRLNPSIIPLHPPHRMQMPQHARRHARNTRHRFEKNVSNHVLSLTHLSTPFAIPRSHIEAPPQCANESESDAIRPGFAFALGDLHGCHLVVGVYGMRPCGRRFTDRGCVWGGEGFFPLCPGGGAEVFAMVGGKLVLEASDDGRSCCGCGCGCGC